MQKDYNGAHQRHRIDKDEGIANPLNHKPMTIKIFWFAAGLACLGFVFIWLRKTDVGHHNAFSYGTKYAAEYLPANPRERQSFIDKIKSREFFLAAIQSANDPQLEDLSSHASDLWNPSVTVDGQQMSIDVSSDYDVNESVSKRLHDVLKSSIGRELSTCLRRSGEPDKAEIIEEITAAFLARHR